MKSPAFQFYPAEFLADENVVMMSNQELGCYIKLMCYCWREGSIPSDIAKIGKLCGENGSAMAQLWIAISSCFKELSNDATRMIHPRLEKERIKQIEHKKERAESGKKGAEARWSKKGNKNGSAINQPLAKHNSSSSSSSSSKKENIKKKNSLPEIFNPTEDHLNYAIQNNINVNDELINFRLYHEKEGTLSASWNSSFALWLRNNVKFRKSNPIQAKQDSLKRTGDLLTGRVRQDDTFTIDVD